MTGHDEAPRIPTSIVLERLIAAVPGEVVTVDWLTGQLGRRSFGIIMFMLGLIALVPGASLPVGVLISLPAVQMILARQDPTLPGFLRRRKLSRPRLVALLRRVVPPIRWIERFVKPRWPTPFVATKRSVGSAILLLGITLISPFPFSHVIPALVIMLMALAYLEEDGVLLTLAGLAALLSLAITVATVWAGIAGGDWLERLASRL